ncbi:unnamed protein product [Bathycoccus prasinos]
MDEDFFAHLLEQIDYTPKVLLVLVSKSSASGEGRRRPLSFLSDWMEEFMEEEEEEERAVMFEAI